MGMEVAAAVVWALWHYPKQSDRAVGRQARQSVDRLRQNLTNNPKIPKQYRFFLGAGLRGAVPISGPRPASPPPKKTVLFWNFGIVCQVLAQAVDALARLSPNGTI